MNDNVNQVQLKVKQLFSFPGLGLLTVVLAVCYIVFGIEFTIWIGSGVLLGLVVALIGVLSNRDAPFRFSIRGILIVVTGIAIFASWNRHLLLDTNSAIKRIEELGGKVNVNFDSKMKRDSSDVSIIRQKIQPYHLNYLRSLPNVKSLDLDYTKVGNSGMAYIGNLKELQWLDIEDTGITDDGLKHLRDLPQLQHIIVDGNSVTDKGLMHLAGNKSLISVRLLNCQVTPDGVRQFKMLLPNCRVQIVPVPVVKPAPKKRPVKKSSN